MKKIINCEIKFTLITGFIWFFFIISSLVFVWNFFPYSPEFPYSGRLKEYVPMLGVIAQFDGVHYLTIIENGYLGTGLIQAFFPIYPFLVKLVSLNNPYWPVIVQSAFITNIIIFIGIALIFPQFIRQSLNYSANLKWFWLSLLLFPTSFFLIMLYSEGLFFLLMLLFFIAIFQQKWWVGALLAGLASGTRLIGLFFLPVLLFEWFFTWFNKGDRNLSWWLFADLWLWIKMNFFQIIVISLISLSGWLIYSGYLWITFNDPLYYFHVQEEFAVGRSEEIVLLPQVAFRYLKMMVYSDFSNAYVVMLEEAWLSFLAVLALFFSWKLVKPSIWLFSFLSFILPTLTGTFTSMPRYLLLMPVIWLVLGYWASKHQIIRWVILGTSFFVLLINLYFFGRGIWVA